MKKLIATVLCLALLIPVLAFGASAAAGLENFRKSSAYTGVFTDVAADSWFYGNVAGAYEYGLMKGVSDSQFAPGENVRLSEAIAMAARLHSIYQTGTDAFIQGTPWYQVYVDYAVQNGIITAGQFADFNAFATRAQFAQIFAYALPDGALGIKNTIADGAIPDVGNDSAYIYKLFRAGVMTGKTEAGAFYPDDNIQRSEAAAVVTRMAVQELRVSFTIGTVSGTDKVDLKNKVLLAQEALASTLENYGKAKKYYLAAVTFGTSGDGMLEAMMSALSKATNSLKDCSKYIDDAITLCANSADLSDISDKLEAAGKECSATIEIFKILVRAESSSWSSGEKHMKVIEDALAEVVKALG